MRLRLRLHEWLADHTRWVQYPKPGAYQVRQPMLDRMAYRWQRMNGAQRGWVLFALFWGFLIAVSVYGNLID